MDSKSLEMLDFRQISEIVAGFTSFSASRELALNLQPLSDYEQIFLLLGSRPRHATSSRWSPPSLLEGPLTFQKR